MSSSQSAAKQAGGLSGIRAALARIVQPAAPSRSYEAPPRPQRDDDRCFAVHPHALGLGLVPSLRCVLERHATGVHVSSNDPKVGVKWTGNFASGECGRCRMARNDLHLGCADCVAGRLDRIGYCTDCCETLRGAAL